MNKPNLITAIVLHFRTPRKTIKCLNSIAKEKIEKIVIIDNSEDEGVSLSSVNTEIELLKSKGLNINILSTGKNMGFAAGVNYGLSNIDEDKTSYILLINSDAEFEENAIKNMLIKVRDYAYVYPLCKNDKGIFSLINYYQKHLGLIIKKKKIGCIPYVTACCLLIKKQVLKKYPLDEDFFFYGEDVFFSFLMEKISQHSFECKNSIVMHEGSASAKNGSLFYEYHISKAHFILAKKLSKNMAEKIIFISIRMFILPLRATIRSIRFHSLNPWKGLILAIFDLMTKKTRTMTPKF